MGSKWLRVVMVMISVLVLEAGLSNGCWEQERFALLQLKSFFVNLGEEESSDCCQWERVECNITTRRVTKLSLNYTLPHISTEKWYLNVSLFIPFEELRSLYLNQNEIAGCVENEGFGKLSKLSRLEVLDLSYNHFNASILSSLSKISSLKSLSLARNDLITRSNHTNDLKWLSRLSSLKNLKTLDLSGNQIESLPSFHELCALSNLETLDMSFNAVNQFVTSKDFLAKNRCLRKLKNLYLDGVFYKQSFSLVSFLEPFSSVKTLFFRYNTYFNKTAFTQELLLLSNVEVLILDNTPLDMKFLESIGSLTSLKILSLYNCSLAGILPAQGYSISENCNKSSTAHEDAKLDCFCAGILIEV